MVSERVSDSWSSAAPSIERVGGATALPAPPIRAPSLANRGAMPWSLRVMRRCRSIVARNVYRPKAFPPGGDRASVARTAVRADAIAAMLVANRRTVGAGARPRLTPPAYVPTMVGRATPCLWSPFLRVGARTLRTEQCAKSQCVYPVDLGRCGSPCLPARRSYDRATRTTGRPIRVCCSVRPTFQHRTRNRPQGTDEEPVGPGPTVLYGEFDPGSGRTLAACLTHASRARPAFRGGF